MDEQKKQPTNENRSNFQRQKLTIMMNTRTIAVAVFVLLCGEGYEKADAFAPHPVQTRSSMQLEMSTAAGSFIQTELRDAAMKLHTREQAPKEGHAESKKMEPYTPTRNDYLAFLVDSQHVYQAMEDIVNDRDELAALRNTGLERVKPLEKDIEYMMAMYNLKRPNVGKPGQDYANSIRQIASIPEFICHYYNFYFAHTGSSCNSFYTACSHTEFQHQLAVA